MQFPPRVGLTTDSLELHGHPLQTVGEKYVRALVDGAGCTPLLLPSLQPPLRVEPWLPLLDGLLLTGAVSNIAPEHYEGGYSWPGSPHDPARDGAAFALLAQALAVDLPVLAICRGFQELNVFLGGSLHPQLHRVDGMRDHRQDRHASLDVQYGPAHAVTLQPDGWLAQWHGGSRAVVNSVHCQGIHTLAADLQVEACSDDGLIEAARSRTRSFVLGVQWHPEWRVAHNAFYHAIFHAFGQACRRRQHSRQACP